MHFPLTIDQYTTNLLLAIIVQSGRFDSCPSDSNLAWHCCALL